MLKKLLALMAIFKNVDLIALLEIAELVKSLIDVGLPPDVSDEKALRNWLSTLLDTLDEAADHTATEMDDKLCRLLGNAVDNDEVWGLFYGLLKSLLKDEPDTGFLKATALGDKVGIDPLTIITLVNLLIEVIKMFKKG